MSEEDKIMMDGEPLEIGNEVYCLLRGKGVVLDVKDGQFPDVIAEFGEHVHHYDHNGLPKIIGVLQKVRTLYWQKPEIIPPPKPKKKIKVWDWYVEWVIDSKHKNFVSRVNGLSEDEVIDIYPGALIQKIDGTEREVER